MNLHSPFDIDIVFYLGPVPVTMPVVMSWGIMAFLVGGALLVRRQLEVGEGRMALILEAIVVAILDQLGQVMQCDGQRYLALLGTLFLFIATANLSGLLPSYKAPTATLETCIALALVVFGSVQAFGIASRGFRAYINNFAEPYWWMAPLNLLGEVTRTFSLTIRLFGNVMSGEFVVAILLGLAGLFVPVPLMALDMLVGIIQAYIFTILAAVFIGGATGSIEKG